MKKGKTKVIDGKVWRYVGEENEIINKNPFKNCLNTCLVSGGKDCIERCVVEALESGMSEGDILNVVEELISADFKIDALVVLSKILSYQLSKRASHIDVTKEYHGEL